MHFFIKKKNKFLNISTALPANNPAGKADKNCTRVFGITIYTSVQIPQLMSHGFIVINTSTNQEAVNCVMCIRK